MPFIAGNIYWITYSYVIPIHEKISICVCRERPLFFWINSKPKIHGLSQVLIERSICQTLSHDSYLDLSSVKTGSEIELRTARDVGPMSNDMRTLVLNELNRPNKMLSEKHRVLVLNNIASSVK
jgi:hypothetical protein